MKKSLIVNFVIFIVLFAISSVDAVAVNTSKLDIHFENIELLNGSVVAIQEPTISGDASSEITYSVNLNTPGEFYGFTADVVNNGKIDGVLYELTDNQLTAEQKKYLSYEVTYLDGTKVNKNDLLKAGTRVRLRISLEFKKDITIEELPKDNTTISLSLNAYYVQANKNSNEFEINKQAYNENDVSNDKKRIDDKDDTIWSFIKNPKTGDMIITYVLILLLAIIAFVIINKKIDRANN